MTRTETITTNTTTTTSPSILDRGSCFVGHAMQNITSLHTLRAVRQSIQAKSPHATYIMSAYRILVLKPGRSGEHPLDYELKSGHEDDGETGGGRVLLRLLTTGKYTDTAVWVVRWFRGRLLGPIRFTHIGQAGKASLELLRKDIESSPTITTSDAPTVLDTDTSLGHKNQIISKLEELDSVIKGLRGSSPTIRAKYSEMPIVTLERLLVSRQKTITTLQSIPSPSKVGLSTAIPDDVSFSPCPFPPLSISHSTSLLEESARSGISKVLGQHVICIGQMYSSTDPNLYSSDFSKNGYLLIRNAVPLEIVDQARQCLVDALKPTVDLLAPIPKDSADQPKISLMDRQDLAQNIAFLLEHSNLRDIASRLLQSNRSEVSDCVDLVTSDPNSIHPVIPIPFKWLRAVEPGLFTGPHIDRTYVGRMSSRIITCWIPIGPCPPSMGSMVIGEGSHQQSDLTELRKAYASKTLERDGTESGWIPQSALAHQSIAWKTHDFEPGDVCFLDMDIIHFTAANMTDRCRLSCDVRWCALD